jgi:hypothetical protein
VTASTEPPAGEPDRDELIRLLQQAAAALEAAGRAALVVKGTLIKPYPDDPRWSPWTRFVEQPARDAYNLGLELRKRFGRPEVS